MENKVHLIEIQAKNVEAGPNRAKRGGKSADAVLTSASEDPTFDVQMDFKANKLPEK